MSSFDSTYFYGGFYNPGYYYNLYFYDTDFGSPLPSAISGTSLRDILIMFVYEISQSDITANKIVISLDREPFPLGGSSPGNSFIWVTPGESTALTSQNDGAGRYLSGMRSTIYVNVAVRNVQDIAGQARQLFTNQIANIISSVDNLVSNLQFTFLDMTTEVIFEEPIRLKSQDAPVRYGESGEWAYIRTAWEASWYLDLTLDEAVSIDPSVEAPTDVAGCIQGIRNVLRNNGLFVDNTAMIGLNPELFPIADGPFCVVVAGNASDITPQGDGAERYLPGMTEHFTVFVIARNIKDLANFDSVALTSISTSIGVLTIAHQVIDQLHMQFIVDDFDELIVEEPIRILKIGVPWRFKDEGGSREWIAVPLVFEVKWVYSLVPVAGPTIPDQPSTPTASGTTATLTISWDDVPGATSYNVFRDSILVGTVTVAQYIDSNVTSSHVYTIVAVNSNGSSPPSDPLIFTMG